MDTNERRKKEYGKQINWGFAPASSESRTSHFGWHVLGKAIVKQSSAPMWLFLPYANTDGPFMPATTWQ